MLLAAKPSSLRRHEIEFDFLVCDCQLGCFKKLYVYSFIIFIYKKIKIAIL